MIGLLLLVVSTQKATLHIEGMKDPDACPAAVTAALKGCEGVSRVELNFKKKEAVVEFDPSKTTVHDMLKAVKKSGKYTATLAKGVQTSEEKGGAVWTVQTDKPAYAPGDKGKLDLEIACGASELHGYKITYTPPDGIKMPETTREWKFAVAGSPHVTADFEVGKNVEAAQLLVRVSIEFQGEAKESLELTAVISLEKAKK